VRSAQSEARRLQLIARLRSWLSVPALYQGTRSLENIASSHSAPHEPDFAFFERFSDESGLFLDVGANAGMSAVSFRIFNKCAPILSLEPNPIHELISASSDVSSNHMNTGSSVRATDGFATLYVRSTVRFDHALATFERRVIEADWRLELLFGAAFGVRTS